MQSWAKPSFCTWLVPTYPPRLQTPPVGAQTGYVMWTLPRAQHGEQGAQAVLGSIPQHPSGERPATFPGASVVPSGAADELSWLPPSMRSCAVQLAHYSAGSGARQTQISLFLRSRTCTTGRKTSGYLEEQL